MLEGIFLMIAPVAIVVGFLYLMKLGIKKYTNKSEERAFKEKEEFEARKEATRQRLITLISEGKTNVFDKQGNTLLMYALRYQLFDEAERLMQLKVFPEYANKNGETALHLMAAQNQGDLLREALKEVGKPDIPDKQNQTPLHAATVGNAPECVEILIDAGADVNIQEKEFGFTPLMVALRSGYVEVAEILLNNGSDLKLQNFGRQTADEVGRVALARVITTKSRAQVLRELVMKMEALKAGRRYIPKKKAVPEDDYAPSDNETMADDDA